MTLAGGDEILSGRDTLLPSTVEKIRLSAAGFHTHILSTELSNVTGSYSVLSHRKRKLLL